MTKLSLVADGYPWGWREKKVKKTRKWCQVALGIAIIVGLIVAIPLMVSLSSYLIAWGDGGTTRPITPYMIWMHSRTILAVVGVAMVFFGGASLVIIGTMIAAERIKDGWRGV